MAHDIFISYSRTDFDKVSEIKKYVESQISVNCWLDLEGIDCYSEFFS